MKPEHKDLIRLCVSAFIIIVLISWVASLEYINLPSGNPCDKSFTRNYGVFKSCGALMSEGTASLGLFIIFIGLPLVAFGILPLMIEIKKSTKGEKE